MDKTFDKKKKEASGLLDEVQLASLIIWSNKMEMEIFGHKMYKKNLDIPKIDKMPFLQ